jgi:hypothetical protein
MNPTTIQPWYENQEATELLVKAATSGVSYLAHRKQYAITADECSTAEGPIAERLKEIAVTAGDIGLAQQDADYENGIRYTHGEGPFAASGYHVSVEAAIDAIQIGMGQNRWGINWFCTASHSAPPKFLTDLGEVIAQNIADKPRLAA